jgi:hypothetical protein
LNFLIITDLGCGFPVAPKGQQAWPPHAGAPSPGRECAGSSPVGGCQPRVAWPVHPNEPSVLLAWAGSPGRAESAQAAMILANREETPSCLTGGQDPPHVMQGLLPQIIKNEIFLFEGNEQ